MKGFFSKFKDQVKDVIKTIEGEIASAGLVTMSPDPSLNPNELDEASKKRESGEKAFRPRSRTEVAKEYMESDRFFKLFLNLEEGIGKKDEPNEKTQMSLFSKERPTSISSIFYEKVKNSEKIDIGSQEIFELITSSQEPVTKENKPLVLISVIGFHHKKGTVV